MIFRTTNRRGRPRHTAADEGTWSRVQECQQETILRITHYQMEEYGHPSRGEAWKDFNAQNRGKYEDLDDRNRELMQLFIPWFCYKWKPSKEFIRKHRIDVPWDKTPGEMIIQSKQGSNLSSLEIELIEACCTTPLSFYIATAVDQGKGMKLRNMMTAEEVFVIEKSGSQNAEVNDIFFAQTIHVQGMQLFNALYSNFIDPSRAQFIYNGRELILDNFYSGVRLEDKALIQLENTVLLSMFWEIINQAQR